MASSRDRQKDSSQESHGMEAAPTGSVRSHDLICTEYRPIIPQKGAIMENTFTYEDIEQILAQADELLQQIDPEIIEYLEEGQRIQIEQQAQSLKELKMVVQEKIGNEGIPQSIPYSEGVHEAIEDIVKAMEGLTRYLS